MKKILLCAAFCSFSLLAFSQSYMTAAGVRISDGFGLSVKQRVLKKVTVEGVLGVNRDYSSFTSLVNFHQPFLTRYFNLYGGGGLHFYLPIDGSDGLNGGFGVDFLGGLEMNISRLNLSFDLMPVVNLTGSDNRFNLNKGLSIRYIVFNDKDYRKRIKDKEKKRKKAMRQAFFDDLLYKV